MRFRSYLFASSTLAGIVLVTGCAVAPVPLDEFEIQDRAAAVFSQVDAQQEPIRGPIDLHQAMARALKYNLDHRVEMLQAALRIKELDLAHFDLLPKAVAETGYAERDTFNASNSIEVLPGDRAGAESLRNSTSQEKRIHTADIEFSWNILDFGLSYVRARQAADRFLIAEELRRKAAHRVIEDVRTAYWRTVSADRLLEKLRSLDRRVRRVQAESRAITDDRQTSPITAATYERELVEIKRAIEEIERDLSVARTQLASLMNVSPGTAFRLADSVRPTNGFDIGMPVRDMIWTALNNRPELREVWYHQRIARHELDAALLELLPGLHAYAASNYDSNDFLFHNDWVNWGAKASWNVLRVFHYPRKRDVIEAQQALLDEKSLAVAMAIMTQVHVSRVRFLQLNKELGTAQEYLDVQRRLLALMREEAAAGRISEHSLIREEMNGLVAETKRDIAYAMLQNAYANVHASMGLDPVPQNLSPDATIAEIAASLRASFSDQRWRTGWRIVEATGSAK